MTPLDTLLKQVAQLRPVDPTECVDEPEFDPGRLLAWQAGAEDEDAVRHLGACAACRTLLAGLEPLSEAAVSQAVAEPVVVAEPAEVVELAEVAEFPGGGPGAARRSWRATALRIAVPLAAAAGLYLLVRPEPPPPEPLPPYQAGEVVGGVKATRSDGSAASMVFLPHSNVEWTLKPSTTVEPLPSVRVFRLEGPQLVPLLEAKVQVDPRGTVVLKDTAERLLGPTQRRVRLAVVVARTAEGLEGTTLDDFRHRADALVFEAEFDYRLTP